MIWNRIASVLLRQRLLLLIIIGCLTVLMALQIPNLRLQYTFGGLLPSTDSTAIEYERFIDNFGTEGNVLLIGADARVLRTTAGLQAWYELAESIRGMDTSRDTIDDGLDSLVPLSLIDSVFSITHSFTLEKDTALRRFALRPLVESGAMQVGGSVDSVFVQNLFNQVESLPFYEGLLCTKRGDATLLTVFLDADLFILQKKYIFEIYFVSYCTIYFKSLHI